MHNKCELNECNQSSLLVQVHITTLYYCDGNTQLSPKFVFFYKSLALIEINQFSSILT